MTVLGNVNNSRLAETYNGPDTLNVGGTFTNEAHASLSFYGEGDVANINNLDNQALGNVAVFAGVGTPAILNVAGSIDNSGGISTRGGTINVGHTFTNEASGTLQVSVSDLTQVNQAFVNGGLVQVGGGLLAGRHRHA